jgi:hypothetical protein
MLVDLVFALVVALVLTLILVPLARLRSPRTGDSTTAGFIFLLLLLFAFSWAGGLWMMPFGPTLFGVSWLPFVLAGLILALILAAVLPRDEPPPPRASHFEKRDAKAPPPETPRQTEASVWAAFGVAFFAAVLLMAVAITAAYIA